MKNSDHFDKIEAYLDERLSLRERQQFEAEILGDPALAAEVEAHKATRLVRSRLGERGLQADLKKMLVELDVGEAGTPEKKQPTDNSKFYRWATLLLALALCLVLWKLLHPSPTSPLESAPAAAESAQQLTLKDAYIDSLTVEFHAIKAALDSAINLKRSDSPPSNVMQDIKRLRLELNEKDQQIRQLQQQRNRRVGPREIAGVCFRDEKFSKGEKGANGQKQDRFYEDAAEAFDHEKFEQVERLLFPKGSPFIVRADTLIFTDTTQLDFERLELLGYNFLMLDQIPQALVCFEAQKRNPNAEQAKANWNIFRCQITQPKQYRAEIQKYIEEVENAQIHPRKEEIGSLRQFLNFHDIQL